MGSDCLKREAEQILRDEDVTCSPSKPTYTDYQTYYFQRENPQPYPAPPSPTQPSRVEEAEFPESAVGKLLLGTARKIAAVPKQCQAQPRNLRLWFLKPEVCTGLSAATTGRAGLIQLPSRWRKEATPVQATQLTRRHQPKAGLLTARLQAGLCWASSC